MPADDLTPAQRALAADRGTPAEFALAVWQDREAYPDLEMGKLAVFLYEEQWRLAGLMGDEESAAAVLGREVDRAAPASIPAELLALHNAERSRRRFPPLSLDDRLTRAAQIQADDCARRHPLRSLEMMHVGSDGSSPWDRFRRVGYAYRAASENAAPGWRDHPPWFRGADFAPATAMEGWMRSNGHRANVLGQYRHMGAAVAASPRDGTRYFVTTFGTPI